MAMPQAIEKQAAEAEQLQAEIYGSQALTTEVEQPVPDVEQPVEPAVPDNVVSLPQAADPARPDPSEDVAYWKKRFDTVQGKLDAEMPRLYQQIREQGEQIKALSTQLTQQATPPQQESDSLVTQKDIDDYGEDLINAMRRTAQEEARKAFVTERAALEKRFGAVEVQVGQVGKQVEKTAADKFWGEVTNLTPDWLAVDQDPAWIAWLDTSPEYADTTYRELASQAISRGNAAKVAKLVETWKKETGSLPASLSVATPRQPRAELSGQQAPSTVRSGSAAPTAAKIISRAEYEAMYDVRNVQRYGQKKAAEMIAEADSAVAENRVRWT